MRCTRWFFILARRFWPGALTIIVPASARVPLKVTRNTGRLALRQPRSAIANALIAALNQPLISASAKNFRIADLPQRHSGVRPDGRPRRPGAGWGRLLRRGGHDGGYHGAVLEDHPGRRH
jgi:hypothetical protein